MTLLFARAAFSQPSFSQPSFAQLSSAQPSSAQRGVTFLTPDGYTLHAGRYGSGSRGVVLVDGGRFNKES